MVMKEIVMIMQIVGFSSLFLLLVIKLPYLSFLNMLAISIFLIVFSIILKKLMPRHKIDDNDSLEHKVRSMLNVNGITIESNLPTKKIGGFVIPLLPFFSVINKRWEKNLTDEAVIHENVHLYYLQNGWIIAILFLMFLNMYLLKDIAKGYYGLVAMLTMIVLLIHFEYITFKKTHKIGEIFGIPTREWDMNIFLRYLVLYGLQIPIIFFALFGVEFIIKLILKLIGG